MNDEELTRRLYRDLYLIRRVEQEIARVYPTDKIKSPIHLSIGQESVAVGVCAALAPGDRVFPTYRGHAAYLAKGGDLRAMIAELFGKSSGCTRGWGGSMHLTYPAAGVMGASAVVGTNIPLAVGSALASHIRREGAVTAAFFGDGAVEVGVFHESMNFAALRKLPLLFVCENNDYAIHTPRRERQPGVPIREWCRSYGIEAHHVPDGDVFAVHEAAARLVERLRTGEGPFFLECAIYRWMEHVGPSEDFATGYRNRSEAEEWMARDPYVLVGELLSPSTRAEIQVTQDGRIADAFAYAESSQFPDPAELFAHLYDEDA